MSDTMTSRERLLAAMRCEDVDHLPSGPFGLARHDINAPLVQELIARTDPFLQGGLGGNAFIGGAAEMDVQRVEGETRQILHTPHGDLLRRVQHTEVASATVEYPLKELDDIERLLAIPYTDPDINAEHYWSLKRDYDDAGLVLAPIGTAVCVAADWFGPELFCLYWATDPDRIIELTQVMNERVCRYVERCCEQGITEYRLVGGEYVSAQIGPNGMPALLREPDKQVIEIIHAYDGVAFYHNHGRMMPFLEDYAYIGVDFLEPMEAPPWGDTDLKRAGEIVDGRYCMVGNLDDMEVVDKLDTEKVCEIARERIEQAGVRGFVLSGTASGTYTERGIRNFIAMAEVAREYHT